MNLEDFIRDSLVQIIRAVESARATCSGVAPDYVRRVPEDKTGLKGPGTTPIHIVEFDVAVTASRDAEVAGGAKDGIISVVSGSLDSKLTTSKESISRLKFTVPIVYNAPGQG
jgi:hypothetical protein